MSEEIKRERIKYLIKTIGIRESKLMNYELNPDDYKDSYDDLLNESGYIEIGTLQYEPSQVLKAVDPTAYRCGLNDYIDSIYIRDTDGYRELENEIDDLKNELYDLENEEDTDEYYAQ